MPPPRISNVFLIKIFSALEAHYVVPGHIHAPSMKGYFKSRKEGGSFIALEFLGAVR